MMFNNLPLCILILATSEIKFGKSQLDNLADGPSIPVDPTNLTREGAESISAAIKSFFDVTKTPAIVDAATSKCCGRYGCFTIQPPFGLTTCRPIAVLPSCQEDLQVRFLLWTRENRENEESIDPEDPKALNNSKFRKAESVIILVNGYASFDNDWVSYIKSLKDEYLNKKDCMFISVSWERGSFTDIFSAIANSQMVAAITANFIQTLMAMYEITPKNFHLIGISLAAHIVGAVGKRILGIGRITGLDPGKPFYEFCDATLRLSRTDANFVDIVHSDGDGVGTRQPSGHVDIFVNGGRAQPACNGLPLCSHPYATYYYIDSLKESKCPYLAYQCDDQDNFMRGKCSTGCGEDNSLCVPLGDDTDKWIEHRRESPTLFFMATDDKGPFCVYHYYVEINCTDKEIRLWRYGRNTDHLSINLIGANGQTGMQQAKINSIRYTTMPSITTLITSKIQIGSISSIILKWEPSETKLSNPDCHNVTEPTDGGCCAETDSAKDWRCLACPYIISTIFAKNLETGNSTRFDGKDEPLMPNTETSFSRMQNAE